MTPCSILPLLLGCSSLRRGVEQGRYAAVQRVPGDAAENTEGREGRREHGAGDWRAFVGENWFLIMGYATYWKDQESPQGPVGGLPRYESPLGGLPIQHKPICGSIFILGSFEGSAPDPWRRFELRWMTWSMCHVRGRPGCQGGQDVRPLRLHRF